MARTVILSKINIVFLVNLILQGFLTPLITVNILYVKSENFDIILDHLSSYWIFYIYFMALSSPTIYSMIKHASIGGKKGWILVAFYLLFFIFLLVSQFGVFLQFYLQKPYA
jgi:hypothetical protein